MSLTRGETETVTLPTPATGTADGVLLVASDARDVAWSPVDDRIAIAIDEGVTSWRRSDDDWRRDRSLRGPSASADAEEPRHVCRVAFAPDGQHLASGDEHGLIDVWDLDDGACRLRLRQDAWVTALTFDPSGRRLASAGDDGVARIWDVHTGQPLLEVEHGVPLTAIDVSDDGRLLATAGRDGSVRLWEAETGVPVGQLDHACTVFDLAFSPDDRRLATAARDRTARVWDAVSGELLLELPHGRSLWGRAVQRVVFSPDGGLVATAGCDKTARVWNVSTGAPVLEIGHEGPVDALAFAPDGRQLVTVGGEVRIWDTDSGQVEGHLGVRTDSMGERMADAVGLFGAAVFGLGVVAVVVFAVGVLLVDLFGPWVVDDVVRSPDGTIVEAGILDLGAEGEVRVGDCLVERVPRTTRWIVYWLEDWWGDPIVGVPCEDPHDLEVLAMEALPGATGGEPVDERIVIGQAEALCDTRFAEYVGTDVGLSELTYRLAWPSVAAWQDGDRMVECWLTSRDGRPLEGSMRGRAR